MPFDSLDFDGLFLFTGHQKVSVDGIGRDFDPGRRAFLADVFDQFLIDREVRFYKFKVEGNKFNMFATVFDRKINDIIHRHPSVRHQRIETIAAHTKFHSKIPFLSVLYTVHYRRFSRK